MSHTIWTSPSLSRIFTMIAERFPEIAQLPDEAELWQDVTEEAADDNPALDALMEQRWREYREHPERVSPWSEVKARIMASRA